MKRSKKVKRRKHTPSPYRQKLIRILLKMCPWWKGRIEDKSNEWLWCNLPPFYRNKYGLQ